MPLSIRAVAGGSSVSTSVPSSQGPTLGKLSKKQQMNFALPKGWSAQTLPAQSVTFKNARFGGGAVACKVDEKDEEDEEDEADVKLGVVLGEAMSPLMLLKQTLHNLITRDDAPGIVHAFIMHCLAKSVTERLAPKAFKVLISAVKMRYDKVPVACMLAQAMPNFRCAHVIAALSAQGVKVLRTNLVISLSPFCKDLEAKKGRIAAVLEPWELAAWKGVTGLQIPMAAQPQLSHLFIGVFSLPSRIMEHDTVLSGSQGVISTLHQMVREGTRARYIDKNEPNIAQEFGPGPNLSPRQGQAQTGPCLVGLGLAQATGFHQGPGDGPKFGPEPSCGPIAGLLLGPRSISQLCSKRLEPRPHTTMAPYKSHNIPQLSAGEMSSLPLSFKGPVEKPVL